jgi:hypothetical protein
LNSKNNNIAEEDNDLLVDVVDSDGEQAQERGGDDEKNQDNLNSTLLSLTLQGSTGKLQLQSNEGLSVRV